MTMQVQVHVQVGEVVPDLVELDRLPIGTAIARQGRVYVREEDGMWMWREHRYTSNQFTPGAMTVDSLPAGVVLVPRPVETLEQYMWRFRDYALWSASNHSVNYEASRDVLDALGTTLPLGRGVTLRNHRERDALPVGSLVYVGQPSMPNTFSVLEMDAGRWRRRLGTTPMQEIVTVYRIGMDPTPIPEWLAPVSTDATVEAERISKFKADVWRAGWRLKQSQGWCSTYEAVLRDFGISRSSVNQVVRNGLRPGARVSPDVARTLPFGSVFKWVSSTNPQEFGLYVRARNFPNAAGTAKVGGTTESARNYHSSMEILFIATDPETQWTVDGTTAEVHAVLNALNPGIGFATGAETRPTYIKALDGKFSTTDRHLVPPETGRWHITDFGSTPDFIIHTYPGVTL